MKADCLCCGNVITFLNIDKNTPETIPFEFAPGAQVYFITVNFIWIYLQTSVVANFALILVELSCECEL